MTLPRWPSVCALYALQNSMMFTPCWPSAGPIGGAGVAWPALICSLIRAEIFLFLGGMSGSFFSRVVRRPRRRVWPRRAPRPARAARGILGSELRHVAERQLDGGLPTEDRDEHLELLRVGVDLGDRCRQGLEGAFHHGH